MSTMELCPKCSSKLGDNGLCGVCLLACGFATDTEPFPTVALTQSATDPPGALEDDRFGAYRVLRSIGEGGMGMVYLAEQQHPIRRQVALKVIKLGTNTREVLARFDSERQALALMDHPNIARVFDAGNSERGRPYFVMEYVDGLPITEYCDRRRLNNRERVELFVGVCQAVHHAHQKGIIHRDIKPSNVLVAEHDGKPFPKVIDFGIFKAIDQRMLEQATFTQMGHLVGTPEYMSPEQTLFSANIDTTTDVYSLGVLLYELLAGVLPFTTKHLRQEGLAEMLRIIRDEDPPTPSEKVSQLADTSAVAERRRTNPALLRRQLSGDLSWIVMKALEKERARRYGSVSELAADIRRHLEDQPVMASPPSLLYRSQKFIRRHKLAVLSGLLVAASLIIGIGLAAWQARVAQVQRVRANAETLKAEQRALQAEEQRQLALDQRKEAERQGQLATHERVLAQEQQKLAEERGAAAAAQRDANRRLLYVAQMKLAAQDLEATNIERVESLLLSQMPATGQEDLRGFEWYYLWRMSHRECAMVRFRDRARWPGEVVFFPDGKRVAVGTSAGVQLLDVEAGQEIGFLRQSLINKLAVSPDGKILVAYGNRVVSGKYIGEVMSWDLEGQRRTDVFETAQKSYLNFNSIGLALAKGGDSPVIVERAPNSAEDADEISVWDGRAHQVAWTRSLPGPWSSNSPFAAHVIGVAVSPDGNKVAIGMAGDAVFPDGNKVKIGMPGALPNVLLLDRANGQTTVELRAPESSIHCLAFSPDSTILAAGSAGGVIKLWNVQSGTEIKTLRSGPGARVIDYIEVLAFSPDGSLLASADYSGSIKLWNVPNAESVATLNGGLHKVYGLAFSVDGTKVAATSTDGAIRFWDVPQKTDSFRAGFRVGQIALSPGGEMLAAVELATADAKSRNRVRLWNLQSGQAGSLPGGSLALTISPGNRLATGGEDGRVTFWDADTLRPIQVFGSHTSSVHQLAFSPDGRALATADQSGTVQIWDTATGTGVGTFQPYPPPAHPAGNNPAISSIAYSGDGTLLATAAMGSPVKLWDSRTLAQTFELEQAAECVSFSPKAKVFAFAGLGDRRHPPPVPEFNVHIRDAVTNRELAVLQGHIDFILSMAFSPDGKRIATASQDRTVKIWDVRSGEELATLPHEDAVVSVAFSADGTTLASATRSGIVKLWRSATEQEVLARLKVREPQEVTFFVGPAEPRTAKLQPRTAIPIAQQSNAASASAPALSSYLGTWENVDYATSGITRFWITGSQDKLLVHAWAACGASDCDWHEAAATPVGQGLSLSWDHGFATSRWELSMMRDGRIKLLQHTNFTDGRKNRDDVDFFIRSSK